VALNPNSVVTYQFSFEDFTFTYYLDAAIVAADVGKAVALDTTGTNKVKLTADNSPVFGRLESFEDRVQEGIKVGAVSRKFRSKLTKTGTVVVGDTVTGSATAGIVKASTGTDSIYENTVVEVGTDYAIVEKL
jgi:hypothetical protein